MAVGQGFQVVLAGAQVIRGAALRDHQRQRLFVGHHGFRTRHRALEHRVDLGEIAAVPDPHAVANAVDFAVTRLGRQRHRVQVVEHDLAARTRGVFAVLVGAQRGRGHLDDLVGQRAGAALGRVPVFFDLCGQRAAAGHAAVAAQADTGQRLVEHGFREAVPFDGRIAARVARVEQFAVFDEQQALHQQRRRGVEFIVVALGEARREQGLGAAIEDLEADLGFLVVGGVQAEVGHLDHLRRDARLRRDRVIARLQAFEVFRQAGITEPGVIRAGGREADRIARSIGHAEREFAGHVGEDFRLQARGAGFHHGPGGRGRNQQQADQGKPQLPAALARCWRRSIRPAGRIARPAAAMTVVGQVREGIVQGNVTRRIRHGRGRRCPRRCSTGCGDDWRSNCAVHGRFAPRGGGALAEYIVWSHEATNTFHDGLTGPNQNACNPRQPARHLLLPVRSSDCGVC